MTARVLADLLARHQPGFSLPRAFYTDEDVFRLDMERVFRRCWLFAGFACQAATPGDYFTFAVGDDSLIILRGDDGRLRALFNICRHRGSRLCTSDAGHCGKIVCPYHQWVYERDGLLAAARFMGRELDKSQYALHTAHLEEVAGLVYVCLTDEPPDFAPARQTIEPFVKPHGLDRAKVCYQQDYTVEANWKLIFENNRECYHCSGGHPQFCQVNFDVGMPGDPRQDDCYRRTFARMREKWENLALPVGPVNFPGGAWFRCARVPLREGYITESIDGAPVAPLMGDLPMRDLGSLRVINLPNAWLHLNSDNANSAQLFPLGPHRTRARLTWLVDAAAVEGKDYHPGRVAEFWKLTTEQDWELCAGNHAGVRSSRYQPGPLSALMEAGVVHFHGWYLRHLDGTRKEGLQFAPRPANIAATRSS
jgi:Rieske 2Fe-2S family protein